MSSLRFRMVEEAFKRKAVEVESPERRPSEYYGQFVFNREKMQKYLSKDIFAQLIDTIDNAHPLSRTIADGVAVGMKQWAMEMGATHYTHWFHPLTGGTAEKHDAFVEHDGKGGLVEEFSGKLLVQQEADGSSFPNGGVRNTFEARGYTAWDPTSPAFVVGTTLCIPTIFLAYTGETLDYKTPLIRSMNAINRAATDVCRYFDPNVNKVTTFLGWEQEYFLVDVSLCAARPDILLTGRTLLGHESAKNQQLEDHYFGSIPTRVTAFMRDLEYECYKLGIPCKTRHNEVAPNQFELAPIYEEANLANDHNLLLMSVMKKVARRHNFKVLLHEKPFKGVNGSGKHNNWSLGTDTGINLCSPGKTAEENLQFITFLVNIMMALHQHNGLLKASIATATNAHRLGASEAPPAIMSIFLGKQINEVLDKLEASSSKEAVLMADGKVGLNTGVTYLPEILLDNTDRNRTSPFAFTGNRFEFRAVGSSANCASALIVLNAVVARQLQRFKQEVDELLSQGVSKDEAIFNKIKEYIKKSKPILFDGNGYSDAWKEEAARRGLDCEVNVPRLYDKYLTPESVDMFARTGVLSEKELHSRSEVKWEIYTKKIQIEARVLGDLASNHVLPTVGRYQSQLLDKVYKAKAVCSPETAERICAPDLEIIETIAEYSSEIRRLCDTINEERRLANMIDSERDKALRYQERVTPMLDEIRRLCDRLELIVDDEMWPLPKYRELLFIR